MSSKPGTSIGFLQPHNHRSRVHSNTVSGDRPPAIDTSITPPPSTRRNSEGSPRLPVPPINISSPSPVVVTPSSSSSETLSLQRHFPDTDKMPPPAVQNETTIIQTNGKPTSRSPSPKPPPPVVAPEPQPSLSSRFLAGQRKSRSRGSSVSTMQSTSESPDRADLQTAASSEKSLALLDQGSDTFPPPGSIAAACNVERANAKRNQDFHALFRSVPENDPLIEDFGCALQKEILLQGRIYISENHLCFNANIFGWVTNLVIAFSDIVAIEKKSTALFIPNAIQVSTLHAKHFFASFLSRDQAYDLMHDIWKQSRPSQRQSSGNESSSLAEGDKASDEESEASSLDDSSSGSFTDSEDDDRLTASEEDVVDNADELDGRQASMASLPLPKHPKDEEMDTARRRAISEVGPRPQVKPTKNDVAGEQQKGVQQTRTQTECACAKSNDHYPKVVMDQVFDCTIEEVYNLLYHGDFIRKFLEDQKNTEIIIGEWREGEGDVVCARELSYVKHLNGSIGPKSTKCLLTEQVLYRDFDDYVTQVTTTQTPDVPSGGSFHVKTRVCLMWAGKGKVRVLVTVQVEFTKSSWIKSTIESATISGQEAYYKDLAAAIRKHLASQRTGISAGEKPHKKTKKAKRKHKRKEEKGIESRQKQEEKKTTHEILDTIINKLTKVAEVIPFNVTTAMIPSTSQMTVICMFLLVITNLFIAIKLAHVDKQLEVFSQSVAQSATSKTAAYPTTSRLLQRDVKKVEDELWDWLSGLDPDRHVKAEPIDTDSSTSTATEEDETWRARLRESQLAKDRLDRHMADLESMIQRATANMEQVTKVVDTQRQKILSEWTS